MNLHDTCSNFHLHGISGISASLLSAVFAVATQIEKYKQNFLSAIPGESQLFNSTEFDKFNISITQLEPAPGRRQSEQAGFQLIAFASTFGIALLAGGITGLVMRSPLFDKLKKDVEMFDDEAQWVTPDDYALKLTLARTSEHGETITPLVPMTSHRQRNSDV